MMSNSYKFRLDFLFVLFFLAVFFLPGCASVQVAQIAPDEIKVPVGVKAEEQNPQTLEAIRERNRTVEDDPAWIEDAYDGLKIRNLKTVSGREYERYKGYIENGTVYVIVHPAYYSFFHAKSPPEEYAGDDFDPRNAVERILSQAPGDAETALLQAQERRTRDFLEYKTTDKKLVVLIIPRSHRKFSGYAYKDGPDEFTRFLNEATNGSDSVVYLESRSATSGYLKDEDLVALIQFLAGTDAKQVLIGGGYVGRCLENFYVNLAEDYGTSGIYLVPELVDISPSDMNNKLAARLLEPDGTINSAKASESLLKDVYNVQEVTPQIYNLK